MIRKIVLIIATALLFMSLFVVYVSRGTLSYVDVVESTGSIVLPKGVNMKVINSVLTVNGSITGEGSNGVMIRNSTIYMVHPETRSFVIKGGGKPLWIENSKIVSANNCYFVFAYAKTHLENVTFDGFGTPFYSNKFWMPRSLSLRDVALQNVSNGLEVIVVENCRVQNLSFSGIPTDLKCLLLLNNVHNSVVANVNYEYTVPMDYVKNAVGIWLDKCSNLTFTNLKCVGLAPDVDTPHGHFVSNRFCQNITVENNYFYGGGNGAVPKVAYRNCTFQRVVDGTESWYNLPTFIYDCTFIDTVGADINIQSGCTWRFTRCTFAKGYVNLSNGTAVTTNCTFPNGITTVEYGDNRNGKKYAGTLIQYWNFSNHRICMKTNWTQNLDTVLEPNMPYTVDYVTFSEDGTLTYMVSPQ